MSTCHECYVPLIPIGCYLPSQIEIDFDPSKYAMQSTPEIDGFINDLWHFKMTHAIKENKILFNASKFRLHNCSIQHHHHHPHQVIITLRLGLTDYKTFIGVAAAIEKGALESKSSLEEPFSDATARFPNILGVETCVATSDRKCLLFRRSHAVAEYPDCFVFPGGHPEPARCREGKSSDLNSSDSERVRQEFLSSSIDEIIAEAGIPRETIFEKDSLRLIGITVPTAKIHKGGKPVACFVVKTSCTLAEMLSARFGAEEKDEFDQSQVLVIGSRQEAKNRGGHKNNNEVEEEFTPATVAILDFLSESEEYLQQ